MRLERYHSSTVRPVGASAATASLRPGWAHQPPWEADRKPSQDLSPEQPGEPAHCQAVRSSATSQAAATRSTVRLSARSRTRTPYARALLGMRWPAGSIQWARLTTMKGSSSSHRARVLLPDVSLDQTYASGTGRSWYRSGCSAASTSSAQR